VYESLEEVSVVFVADQNSAPESEPTDGPFDFPPVSVAPERPTVLQRRSFSIRAMRGDLFDAATFKSVTQPVRIGGFIVKQSLRTGIDGPDFNQGFNRMNFCKLCRGREGRDGDALAIGHHHQFGPFALFGFAYIETPFFAGEKVPSPIACDQSKSFLLSKCWSNRCQALTISPASVQSRCRRQHVQGEGYCVGKKFHGEPVLRIHRIPSKQAGGLTRGRPAWGDGSGSSNRSLMRFHWESERNGCGAVLDPVLFGRRRRGHIDRVMVMRNPP